ncbi:conserved Plasmodium protein, unknown function [Plasmodium vinckei vinckei]|uniref:Uncharacterized protein n=1 Tax=Plasmodium vinckei vinckei TaxID=54757 RepID=A0A081I9G1_PLAVN|nr:conserved Plasmodium protein, unknown function [Plasmodium vinckei vinckei]KEG00319.1 hypothetical protein YYE_04830 [Plasmodium vinckei vinckei]VEV54471.1 conserved Plasmodium protein, unknown function [Plasmodium vinckei vinckei]
MFNYFLKGFNNCKNKVDVDHLSKKFLKHIYNFNAYEISLCLNKFSKINYNEKDFWNRVCKLITSSDTNVLTRFEVVKNRQLSKNAENRKGESIENNHINQNKNFLNIFNIEELCLLVNALAKVNIKNEEILKLASNKIMNEININKHAINLLKNISELSTTNVEGASIVSKNISDNYNKINTNLTERDISALIQFILLQKNAKKNKENGGENDGENGGENGGENELEAKLIDSLRKVNYISEQSIALILNACSKGYEKNKKLLDVLKVIIIMKIKNEDNKCSDIFISSITHSYASFYYRDKVLFNLISDYTCKNMNSINIKSLIIILNSYVNIHIINLKLFSAAIEKLADKKVIQTLSNQCTSNLVTILTKSYNYLDRQKLEYIFKHIIKRIKWEYTKYLDMKKKKKKKKNISNYSQNYSEKIENLFITSFLMKHLTNILNNLSKLNYADNDVFEIFTYLILKNQNDINKLDFMNIASAYSRHGYINKEIYQLVKKYSKKYITCSDLKYVEFINMFTSIANFYLVEKNDNFELEIQKRDGNLQKQNEHLKSKFKDILNMIINMLKLKYVDKNDMASKEGEEKIYSQECKHNSDQKCKSYNNCIINDKNIIDNLSINHLCSILSTLSKLNIHDEVIFKNILNNLKKKIFKMDSKCLSIYLLYISKFNITLDTYIKSVLSNCFITTQRSMISKKELNYGIPIEDKQNIALNKMEKLYDQLKTNDLVNTVYIIRCMIKNDWEYKSSMPIIYRYLNNIYKICNNKNEEKLPNLPSIIKIDDTDIDEKQNRTNRKMNIHCSSILINTLIILNTHIYNNEHYSKIVMYLLFYAFKHIYELLDLGIPIKKAIYEESDKQTDYIKNVIKKKMDSASIRQINMAALMIYHFTPLNKYTFMSNQINCNKHISSLNCNLNNYPKMIFPFLWFFIKYASYAQFEKYNSIYNSITSDKILINYNYDNNDLYSNFSEDKINEKKKKNMDNNFSLIPHVSHNEISIYSTILNVLKKKKKMEYQVFSSFPIYLYSIDILIMPRHHNIQN